MKRRRRTRGLGGTPAEHAAQAARMRTEAERDMKSAIQKAREGKCSTSIAVATTAVSFAERAFENDRTDPANSRMARRAHKLHNALVRHCLSSGGRAKMDVRLTRWLHSIKD